MVLGNGLRIDLTNGLLIAGRRSMASMLCRAVEVGQHSIKLPLLEALGIAKGDSSIEELNKKSLEAADLLAKGFGSGVPPQSWEVERSNDLISFLHERLKVHLKGEGIRYDVIDACLAMDGNDDLTLLVKRAEALADVLKTEDGENLIQGFKRANNILTQAEEKDGVEYSFGADVKFAETDEEKALFAALDAADARIKPAMEAEDFAEAMSAMASLRAPVDAFFEAVQINAESDVLRRNRLNLLSRIRSVCSGVADLSRLEG